MKSYQTTLFEPEPDYSKWIKSNGWTRRSWMYNYKKLTTFSLKTWIKDWGSLPWETNADRWTRWYIKRTKHNEMLRSKNNKTK